MSLIGKVLELYRQINRKIIQLIEKCHFLWLMAPMAIRPIETCFTLWSWNVSWVHEGPITLKKRTALTEGWQFPWWVLSKDALGGDEFNLFLCKYLAIYWKYLITLKEWAISRIIWKAKCIDNGILKCKLGNWNAQIMEFLSI